MSDVPSPTVLPDGLLDRDQWVCWRRQEREGKTTKVPINPHTGRFGSATDSDTWGTFETATEKATGGSPNGIGFVFTEDDPLVGVDLDDCRDPDSGTLSDEAVAIIERLDSYTEVSPSGTGVHVIVEGQLPDGRNRRDWVECYETARFFTVTGDHLAETPSAIRSRPEALVAVHETQLQPDHSGTATEPGSDASNPDGAGDDVGDKGASPARGHDLSDAELIERARNAANGEKFSRLWRGDTSGYDSHSEADMALCSLLAFWTGGDPTRTDRLFRESGLMRAKWDEQHYADGSTYGEKTVERVIATTDEVYDPDVEADDEDSSDMPTASEAVKSPEEVSDTGTERTDAQDAVDESDREKGQANISDETAANTTATTAENRLSGTLDSRQATGREAELLELIDELQAQVERLEAENERLRAERTSDPTGSEDESPGEDPTGVARLWRRLVE